MSLLADPRHGTLRGRREDQTTAAIDHGEFAQRSVIADAWPEDAPPRRHPVRD